MGIEKRIALLCDYRLMPERIGGMDYFFWAFHKKCNAEGITVDWFFPNQATHNHYKEFSIFSADGQSIENKFIAHCQEHHPTYVYVITHFLELCTSFFAKAKKHTTSKCIAIDHNPRPIGGYPLKKKIHKKIKGLVYARYIDHFIGVSNYTVDEIVKDFGRHLKGKTTTIYNGVIIDTIKKREERALKKPTFIVASHLRASKGIQDLIEAVSLLPDTIKEELVIDMYGDGDYKDVLKTLIEEKNLSKVFTFKGNAPNLNTIFCQYDYMLQPTHMECFSLSILESLAANVPVVTTNVGGNEEAIQHRENGYIFNAKDIHALKELLQGLYTGSLHIAQDTRIAISEQFSLEQMVNKHYALMTN